VILIFFASAASLLPIRKIMKLQFYFFRNASNNVGEDRPFVCPVPGCKKRYKNVNGIKYHAKNGHKKDTGK
jgi:hypothetical protein